MTRTTSIQVYHEIVSEGLLGKRQLEVYQSLFENGPMTQVEVVRFLQAKARDITDHGYTPRFCELRRMGAIYEVSERVCSVTGRTVIEWDVTDKLPVKLSQTLNLKEQRIEAACKLLDELNDDIGLYLSPLKIEEIKLAVRNI